MPLLPPTTFSTNRDSASRLSAATMLFRRGGVSDRRPLPSGAGLAAGIARGGGVAEPDARRDSSRGYGYRAIRPAARRDLGAGGGPSVVGKARCRACSDWGVPSERPRERVCRSAVRRRGKGDLRPRERQGRRLTVPIEKGRGGIRRRNSRSSQAGWFCRGGDGSTIPLPEAPWTHRPSVMPGLLVLRRLAGHFSQSCASLRHMFSSAARRSRDAS